MSPFKRHFNRKTIRIRNWDYGMDAAYFVTICSFSRQHLFGELIKDKWQREIWMPRPAGLIATKCWADIKTHYSFVRTDEFVVMPNHMHGIVFISDSDAPHEFINTRIRLSANFVSQQKLELNANRFGRQVKNLQSVIGGFKSAVTKESRLYQPDFRWQSRYHDRLIRNEEELAKIRLYIRENRKNWFFKNEYLKYGDLYL